MERERPYLALLDLLLPDTDGIDLMQVILKIADVPVIFLSAYGREETTARAFEMGAVNYMVKPFSPTELVARMASALRQREVEVFLSVPSSGASVEWRPGLHLTEL